MGTILKVKNADFSENGMILIPPQDIDVMSEFQENIFALGTCITINQNGIVNTVANDKRIAANKTTISTNQILHIKPKSGFEIALGMWKDNASRFGGSTENGGWTSKTFFSWISPTKEFVCSLRQYDTFAFNVRYDDNTTVFTSNTLSDYFDYIKCSYANESTPLAIIKSVIEASYFEHSIYSSTTIYKSPLPNDAGTRNAVGVIFGDAINYHPFVIIPKNGCKIVPIQSGSSSSGAQFPYAWTTSSAIFRNIETYPLIGFNLAYTDDRVIPSGTSIWDFIYLASDLFITQFSDYGSSLSYTANTANAGWAFCEADQQKVRGKTINFIRFKASAAGDMAILVGSSMTTCTQRANVVVASEEVGQVVTKTFNAITIGVNEYLAVGTPNGAGMYYGGNHAEAGGFYSKIPSNPSQSSLTLSIGIDVGYMEQ